MLGGKGGGKRLIISHRLVTFIMIPHETHPCDILIFDHTALAVAPSSLLSLLPSAILGLPFAAGSLRSVHTTDQWLNKDGQRQNGQICTD